MHSGIVTIPQKKAWKARAEGVEMKVYSNNKKEVLFTQKAETQIIILNHGSRQPLKKNWLEQHTLKSRSRDWQEPLWLI